MRKSILITGADGFIGSALAHRLVVEGYAVTGLVRSLDRASGRVPHEVQLQEWDILSKDIGRFFANAEVVFHFAGLPTPAACEKDPFGTMETNVAGAANVFDAAHHAGARKVIYASSYMLRSAELRHSFYGVSKAACEDIATAFHHACGLTTIGLRYANVYGPGQEGGVVSAFARKLSRGERPVIFEGCGEDRRDFLHIDDLTDFHLLCIQDNRADNQILEIGTGESHSLKDVLEILQKVSGTDIEPEIAPCRAVDHAVNIRADTAVAHALGWQSKITLEEGLQRIAAQYKK